MADNAIQCLIAHSRNESGDCQPLASHLVQTADMAARFAQRFGAGDVARLAALTHDLGKASERFQLYLDGIGDSGGDHKGAGVIQASNLGLSGPISFAIAGHHGGLPSFADVKGILGVGMAAELGPRVGELLSHLAVPPNPSYPAFLAASPRETEFFTRMLFSALVDADYLDTEAHFSSDKGEKRGGYPSLVDLWPRFDHTYQSRFTGEPMGDLNSIRRDVYSRCLSAAEASPGTFSLTVPTGGGKTLASLGFALRHALEWGLERVIVVIPYTSIIEQTADVFREFVGPDAVLEHHSATRDEPGGESASPRELAAENWDAPIIVTTAVQFFESLFANLPSRCRKLHNVAGSVVIVDEAQTLPLGLLRPTFEVVGSLVCNYQVSFLFTTATQPAYQVFSDLPIREIMPDPSGLARRLRRVCYERLGEPLSWDEVATRMGACEQAMAVVNTRADARSLWSRLPADSRLHLSTNLCGAHRRAVLREVKRRLQGDEPCRLATTQLVEAGVDLDFPVVLRARAPLEALVQAAGRCNREGRQEGGRVLVFNPSDGGLPRGSYETATQATEAFLRAEPDAEIDDPEAQRRYFAGLYRAVDLDAKSISRLRESFDFPAVAEAYRLIADDSVPVAVPWREGEKLLDQLSGCSWVSRADWRRLQPYLVSLRSHEFRRAQEAGLCSEVVARSGLWRWEGGYDLHIGLQWDFDTLIL